MNLCKSGHDKDVVGIRNGQCVECKRAQNRTWATRKRALTTVPRNPNLCRNGLHPKPELGRCQPCRAATNQRWSNSAMAKRARDRAVDGWEDEFGPCPPRASDSAWVDRVVLQRHLVGEPIGRFLTTGETRALHLLGVLRG